jgi:hypothetical protein
VRIVSGSQLGAWSWSALHASGSCAYGTFDELLTAANGDTIHAYVIKRADDTGTAPPEAHPGAPASKAPLAKWRLRRNSLLKNCRSIASAGGSLHLLLSDSLPVFSATATILLFIHQAARLDDRARLR